jgi:hypothetical protein
LADYITFSPGNNIWKKPVRVMALSFERIGIAAGHGFFTYVIVNTAFSYQFSFLQLAFIITMIIATIYAMLPAPSNPHATVLSEVTVRSFKSMVHPQLRGSIKVMPLEREE